MWLIVEEVVRINQFAALDRLPSLRFSKNGWGHCQFDTSEIHAVWPMNRLDH